MNDKRSPVEIARELAPKIRASADEIEAERELPKPLFEALYDAGLFTLALPKSLGGSEIDLPTYVQVLEEIGKADASTGWCINQGGIYATYSSRMPHAVAKKIWVDVPRAVVANTPAPSAKAIPVPGGYRVTGRQGFSTGCKHASWLAPHAQILDDGVPRRHPDGALQQWYMFVPAAEAEIIDTWHVRGMRGTGTHHFAVNDVFVPADRCVDSQRAPIIYDAPLYHIPRTLLFASGDAAVALGLARSCMSAFAELAGSKTPRAMPGLLRDQALVQFDLGRCEAFVRSGRALLTEAVGEIWKGVVSRGGDPTLDERAGLRLAATHNLRLAAEVVDILYNHSGATAAYEGHVLQRYFQDIHVITQHLQGRLTHYELIGRYQLGLPIDEARL